MKTDKLVMYRYWEKTTEDLLARTEKFPKAVRFTLTQRVENLAIDVLEELVVARYRTGPVRATALETIDLKLARLRALLRLCHSRQALCHKGYGSVSLAVDEMGRMVGGWRQRQKV